MSRLLTMLAVLLVYFPLAFAQPDPNAPPPPPAEPNRQGQLIQMIYAYVVSQPPLIARMPQGLFIVRGGVLAKYDPANGQLAGMVELFGPLPQANNEQVFAERMRRLLTGGVLVREQELYLVIGEHFFRIDGGTLEVKLHTALLPPIAPTELTRMMEVASAPALAWTANGILVTRGTRLLLVNPDTGKVVSASVLPDQFAGSFPAGKTRKPVALGDNPRPLTVIGILLHHLDHDGDFATVRLEPGGEYLLTGDGLERLLKTPALLGKRLRLTGLASPPPLNGFGKGVLEVQTFEAAP